MAFINGNEVLFSPHIHDNGGFEAGKQAQYDAFWDSYQKNGGNAFSAQFAGEGWTAETFKPKYDIKVTNGYFLFYTNATRLDMVELFKNLGISFDTSEMNSAQYLFWNAQFTRVGEIDFRKLQTSGGHTSQTFASGWLVTIDKLILREDGTNTFSANMFQSTSKLVNITIEGVIGNSINFQYSPLTIESAKSIINALKDYSGTATAFVNTVTFSSITQSVLDEAGAIFNGKTWKEYLLFIGWNA